MLSSRISFANREGLQLAAILDRPVDGEPLAYALFAHCFTCSKDLKAVLHISRSLTAAGYAVLRFDFTGLGQSEGQFSGSSFSTNISDLQSACSWLEDNYEAPSVLIGHSLGGTAVLHVASRLSSVRAVATIGSPYDPAHVSHLFHNSSQEIRSAGEARVEIGGRPFTIKQSFLDDLQREDCAKLVASLDGALLIMHSPVDRIVGIDNASRIYEAARHPKSFVSLDTADHLLTNENDARYVGSVLGAWAKRYLKTPQELVKAREEGEHRVIARISRDRFYTEIIANGHTLVADEPAELDGTNLGPAPMDMLMSALAGCTAITLRMYADRKEWPLEGVHVQVEHSRMRADECEDCDLPEGTKGRVNVFESKVKLMGDDLSDAQKKRIMQIANKCPVHRVISGTSIVKTILDEDQIVSTDPAL